MTSVTAVEALGRPAYMDRAPSEASLSGIHIHVDNEFIFVEGVVATATAKDSVMRACRAIGGSRRVMDLVKVDAPASS